MVTTRHTCQWYASRLPLCNYNYIYVYFGRPSYYHVTYSRGTVRPSRSGKHNRALSQSAWRLARPAALHGTAVSTNLDAAPGGTRARAVLFVKSDLKTTRRGSDYPIGEGGKKEKEATETDGRWMGLMSRLASCAPGTRS